MSRVDPITRVREILGAGRLRTTQEERRDQIFLGVVASVVVAVVTAALGLIYLHPLGYQQYRAEFANASGVRTGDQVRIAGIVVGQVKSVDVENDHIAVDFTVKSDITVGEDSSLAIKMLTPVGGRYLMLGLSGDEELGDQIIPRERVTGTYDLTSILEKATPKAEALDGDKLRTVIEAANKSFGGNSQTEIGSILDSAASLADDLGARSQQLQGALRVSDEYLAATTKDREIVFTLIKSLNEIGVGLGVRYDQVQRTFNLLRQFFVMLERLTTFYQDGFETLINAGADLLSRLKPLVDDAGDSLRALDGALERLRESITMDGLTIDQSGQTIQGVRVCVPNPAREC